MSNRAQDSSAVFKFKDLENGQALVGLLVTDNEFHDFYMTVEEINSNMIKFGESHELVKAKEALLQKYV